LFGGSLAAKNPNLGKALTQLNITAEGPRVALALKLDEATVRQLSEQADAAGAPPAPVAPLTDEEQAVPPPAAPPSQDS
jgi:hypothetical protein